MNSVAKFRQVFLQRTSKTLPIAACFEFHTSSTNHAKVNRELGQFREARMIKKLMTGSNRPKKKFFTVDQTPAKAFAELKFLDPTGPEKKRTFSNRSKARVKVLNVLFVEHITSLLSTGEVGTNVLDLGLEITQVRISPDFSTVTVYWKPSGTDRDVLLERELRKAGGILRHKLSQLRVMGIVPPIYFAKDPFEERLAQIESTLAKLDFGEDYVPTTTAESLKQMRNFGFTPRNRQLNISADVEDIGERDERLVAESEDAISDAITSQTVEEILMGPQMRQDILGLDHAGIMKKIVDAAGKTAKQSAEYRSEFGDSYKSSDMDKLAEMTDTDRRNEFIEYINKKRRDKMRLLKMESTDAKEREFISTLKRERMESERDAYLDRLELAEGYKEDEKDTDYVEDVYEEKK